MCGIAGIYQSRADVTCGNILPRMIAQLSHRGPDATSTYFTGDVGLGHTRLSIIDVVGGRQPMSTPDGSLCITFNGEVFNYIELRHELNQRGHTFKTQSDTEVILHLYQEYGEDCVHRLNGQWAFAIWDEANRKLFLSRDRLGIRPLFYHQAPGFFCFASEIKALFAHPGVPSEVDLHALDQLFTMWVTLPPRTAFKNISELPPGHSLIIRDRNIRVYRYWTPEYSASSESPLSREKQLTEDLLDLLIDATRIRLRSDVPVATYLSGGLDSTVITALIHALMGNKLRTFSVRFDDAEFDEGIYQREASAFLHTHHTDVCCSHSDIAAVFPQVIWHTEQPILRTAPAPLFLLSSLVRAAGFKVVLTGEGADELFGGYDIFQEMKIRHFWARAPESRWRPLLLKRLYPYLNGMQRQPTSYLKEFFQIRQTDVGNPFFSHLPRWQLTSKLKQFFSDQVHAELASANCLADLTNQLPASFASWDHFAQAEHLETMYLLPGYILSSQGDRMAMAHSVEGRYPFLDHRVVSFARRLPPILKMKVLEQKYLLKQAVVGLIPESIRRRHKQPYRAPDGKSFFVRKPEYLSDILSEEQVRHDGIFEPRAVSSLLAKFESGRTVSVKDDMALVGILSTQLLFHQFIQKRGMLQCNRHSLERCALSS